MSAVGRTFRGLNPPKTVTGLLLDMASYANQVLHRVEKQGYRLTSDDEGHLYMVRSALQRVAKTGTTSSSKSPEEI